MRLGLLLDGPSVERWADRAIRAAVDETSFRVSTIVLRENPVEERTPSETVRHYLDSLRATGAWGLALAKHRLVNPPEYLRRRPLSETTWGDSAEVLRCEPVPADSLGQRLPPDAVRALGETDATFRRGFGILRGEVLTAPEHGVLSYHHGDIREYRGRPAGFWEFYHGESRAGVTLQRLTETLDGGEIAAEASVDVGSCGSFWEVKERLFAESEPLLATCLADVEEGKLETTSVDDDQLGPLYTDPDLGRLLAAYRKSFTAARSVPWI